MLAARTKCRPSVLSFFDLMGDRPDRFFADVDIIFIDGGSTRNLLAILQEWNAADALRDAYERGVVIAGASAGASILFDWCMTDSVKTEIRPLPGLGFLSGSICVHHGARKDRQEQFAQFLKSDQAAFPAFALDDGVALQFIDGVLEGGLSLTSNGACRRFERYGEQPSEVGLRRLSVVG